MINTIAVLLTCHNRREKTISCLHALFLCQLPKNDTIDVFLVDDGSTDNTSEAVKEAFPKVNLIQGTGDLFWNRGMCLAWESAIKNRDYSFYLWLNDDCLLLENALMLMLEYSKSINNNRIIVGATCTPVDGTINYSGLNFPNKKLIPNGTWQDCDYFNGNIVLIPNFVFKKVGMLDKHFHHFLGDFDYGMRANKIGFVHSLAPTYLGICDDHESEPDWRNRSIPVFKRLKHLYTPSGNNPIQFFIFDKRHFGLYSALIHFISIHLRAFFPSIWENKLQKSNGK